MRNKFVYPCSIKFLALRSNELLESIFCLLLVVEASSLQKVVKMLEEAVVSWREVRWIRRMRQNLMAQFVQLLKCWLCNVQLNAVVEKNWALSVDQCQLQALQFSVHLIYLLNVLLRCNGFAEIQKAVEDQTGSKQTTKQWPWPSLALGSALELPFSPATELVVSHCCMKSTFHHTSQSNWEMVCCYIEEKTTLQNNDFFFFFLQSAHETPTYWVFSLFQFASNAEWQ